jgi:hypothetical protein
MTLRKCPACKNQFDAQSEVCPVCGRNPTVQRLKSFLLWGAAVMAVAWFALHGHLHWATLTHWH